ncbi:GntR family transcriptional regulator [Streptomyces platensis]|uniref:GntR family transcriptional regulator n=1 Tax=Streptomyces platensis TaxID=58346 RepID=UPI002E11E741|nr:GntR family transcriptional regulator [Streptomyces platensis]WSI53653.1 GntR family transcriptional regulator [Streptomyces platensis]
MPVEPPEPTALYRLYDADGLLLYVGISSNPQRRWWEHAARYASAWWPLVATRTVEWLDTRDLAAAAERHAIKTESPAHNFAHARAELPNTESATDPRKPYLAVASRLRAAILSGELGPSKALPSEHELCALAGTTRATVRKGIALLRAEGLVATQQGKGAFVRDPADRPISVPAGHPEEAAELLRQRLAPEDLARLIQHLTEPR